MKRNSRKLQSSISTWYKTLRLIAIVGLLSVLVYVGIRILISSTGQEKAKYKKMLNITQKKRKLHIEILTYILHNSDRKIQRLLSKQTTVAYLTKENPSQ